MLFSLIRVVTFFFIYSSINIKKISLSKQCGGVVVVHVVWSMVWFPGKIFITCPVVCMNSYNIWIHIYDEFNMNPCIFCTLNVWIHTNMNSYNVWMHIFFVWIHIFFAVQNKSCERAQAASAQQEHAAQAASTQHKLQGQSPSSPPALTRPRPAVPTVRVACGSPDS